MNCIADIEEAIKAAGLNEGDVLRAAGVDARHLQKVRRGRRNFTATMGKRLQLAIAELKRIQKLNEREKDTDGRTPWQSRAAAHYRICIAFVAHAAGVTPRFILDADPGRRATADPQWLRAARLRRIALYIASQYLNIAQAEIARAASMSKANVCKALQDLEEVRDSDPEISRILAAVEGAFEG
ncbi:hypothetical protein [Rhizobium halophilum]|uniref:hypothetical protein n=1 Tax=Rhizobium halophilum TaxID=2846852 RepID=UPI001EFEE098|nr:hypothetical protein [Rhizobium halophilum]MCF6368318.1 hypothetical protein [Rhizobium halophilum]